MMEEVDLSDTPLAMEPKLQSQGSYSDEGPPDPRIQVELERLNTSTDLINKLEVDLDEARMVFRQTLSESTQSIDTLTKKLGKCIDQARPYYDARIKAKQSLMEAQKSAVRYERAVSQHNAAREMVQLAEEGLLTRGCIFDSTWQEMLNHATTKVNDAEKEKIESTSDHREKSTVYTETEARVKFLQKELKRAIAKSSLNARRSLLQLSNLIRMQDLQLLPYFELKAAVNQRLEEQKRHVKELEGAVVAAKGNYSQALNNLETISDQIHKTRQIQLDLGIRGVGVGAESPLPPCDIKPQEHSKSATELPKNAQIDSNECDNSPPSKTEDLHKDRLEHKRNSSDGSLQASELTGWQFVAIRGVNSANGSNLLTVEDTNSIVSDSESLTSMEMLSEEVIANLMLEEEIQDAAQHICTPLEEYMGLPKPNSNGSLSSQQKSSDGSTAAQEQNNTTDSGSASWEVVQDEENLTNEIKSPSCDDKEETDLNNESSQCNTSSPKYPKEDKQSPSGKMDAEIPTTKSMASIADTKTHEKVLASSYACSATTEGCMSSASSCLTAPVNLGRGPCSPTRPSTLPVSPSYSKSPPCSSSNSSEKSTPESTPSYAPLYEDTPSVIDI